MAVGRPLLGGLAETPACDGYRPEADFRVAYINYSPTLANLPPVGEERRRVWARSVPKGGSNGPDWSQDIAFCRWVAAHGAGGGARLKPGIARTSNDSRHAQVGDPLMQATRIVATTVVAASALLSLAAPARTEAQSSSTSPPRVGLLMFTASAREEVKPSVRRLLTAFENGLRDHGYVIGESILIDFRTASGRPERLASIAAELVRRRVDVIVAPTTPAALAAQKATTNIPVVMVTASDPVGNGLVASLPRPGGNVTGTTIMGTDLAAKRLELLTQVLPGVSRLGVLPGLSNRAQTPAWKLALTEAHAAARTRGVILVLLALDSFQDFTSASAAVAKERPEALLVLPDPLNFAHRSQIVSFAASHRLPGMYPETEYVEAGGLVAYAADLASLFRRAGGYVDKILKGTKPADLPVEQPTKFELVINLKTAKALGLTIPQSILLRADRVIE